MELAFETCLDTWGISFNWERIDDRRLSERFCSIWSSRIASSMEEVMLNCSAVFSNLSIFPTYAPCRTCKSGVGCRKAMLCPDEVRTIGS
ncbi:hypothetical protein CJF30_00005757 [Rutstroemia sp. NJR-2017a BBW]|nr:hypothetical protein CJF30_00005757 [Rutstroemia sp. NJR-2017a BBW]